MAAVTTPANALDTPDNYDLTVSPSKRPRDDPAALRKRVAADKEPTTGSTLGKVCFLLFHIHACPVAGMAHESYCFEGP